MDRNGADCEIRAAAVRRELAEADARARDINDLILKAAAALQLKSDIAHHRWLWRTGKASPMRWRRDEMLRPAAGPVESDPAELLRAGGRRPGGMMEAKSRREVMRGGLGAVVAGLLAALGIRSKAGVSAPPFAGDLVYGSSSPKWHRLHAGTNGVVTTAPADGTTVSDGDIWGTVAAVREANGRQYFDVSVGGDLPLVQDVPTGRSLYVGSRVLLNSAARLKV